MKRFFTRLFTVLILSAFATIAFGEYFGLEMEKIENFINNLLFPNSSTSSTESESFKEFKIPRQAKESHWRKIDIEKPRVKLQPLPPNPFEEIDRHARNCPDSAAKDIKSLANYLQQVTHTDLEKARAIFVWLAENIHYDDYAYNTGDYGDYSPDSVLASRKAVCEGFSSLFYALGIEMDLAIRKVSGYAKGSGYKPGMRFEDTNHAWNIIKINGQWRVFDATWGGGYGKIIGGKLVSKKKFDDFWFNLDPYAAIFSHMPEDTNLTFVTPNIDLQKFEKMPHLKTFIKLGFNAKEIYDTVLVDDNLKFPTSYGFDTYIKVITAPKFRDLYIGKSYNFEIYVPRGLSVALVDARQRWTYFEWQNGLFKLRYNPQTVGRLELAVKHDKSGRKYQSILYYQVRKMTAPIS